MNESAGRLLEGRAAVVTGSSKGIGQALAIGLARHGAAVAVNYKHDGDGAADTARTIAELGGDAVVIEADVSRVDEATRLIAEAAEHLGRLDILVNNAGRSRFNWAVEITEEDWDDVVNTNLRGAFFASTAAVPHLRQTGNGSIVNISSCAATLTALYHSIYTMSKSGLEGLTKQLALELAPDIRVNAIAPGPTSVERSRSYDPDFDEHWGTVVPMGRVIYPEDLVGPLVFLASDLSRLLTGDVLHVDGGWTTQGTSPSMEDFDLDADRQRG